VRGCGKDIEWEEVLEKVERSFSRSVVVRFARTGIRSCSSWVTVLVSNVPWRRNDQVYNETMSVKTERLRRFGFLSGKKPWGRRVAKANRRRNDWSGGRQKTRLGRSWQHSQRFNMRMRYFC
jgi:hypothetical protein